MQISRLENIEQFKTYCDKNGSVFLKNSAMESKLGAAGREPFTVKGISYPAEDIVDFLVDYSFSNGRDINWRERLVCPVTGLNNRLRAAVHLSDFELGLKEYHSIYITEQLTPLYSYLGNKFPFLTGSEYMGTDIKSGLVDKNGIRHEDMTRLSLKNEEVDFCLSFETLEHIPDYKLAFSEVFRILKKGGAFMWTVPFVPNSNKNIIRAIVTDKGEIKHILEPEYHGDPVKKEGILCYTHFGWEMLDQMRELGFTRVYALIYWSRVFGYLGGDQWAFIAVK